jgi:luciferase family oxidoreductase group 1
MLPFSVLDLAPVPEGSTARDALRNTVNLAQHAEALGYRRFWLAEHHNMPGIASAATSVVIAHVAAHTATIRVGAGGIMLPNHSPLVIAEQFGTLATLFPDRIDLGLGRAPGTDAATTHALRRAPQAADTFPQDVIELLTYLGDPQPGQVIQAVPGTGTHVPVWILGSSLFGAQLAAHLGLPFAFASHFAPDALDQAFAIYRKRFVPSVHLATPHAMMAINVFAADTDDEGAYLKSSMQQAFANLRTGRPGLLPRPVRDLEARLHPGVVAAVDQALRFTATGSKDTVRRELQAMIERHRPDEVMVTGHIHDPEARRRSFQIAAEQLSSLKPAA